MSKRKRPEDKVKLGRHSKYEQKPDEWNLKVWLLAAQGKHNKEICKVLGISIGTLQWWREKHPDFLSGLERGRMVAAGRLEETLYNLAVGGIEAEESRVEGIIKKDSKGNIIYDGQHRPVTVPHKIIKVKKTALPDRESLLACLRVWKPQDWDKATRLHLGGDEDAPPLQVQLTNLTDDDLMKMVTDIAARKQSGKS